MVCRSPLNIPSFLTHSFQLAGKRPLKCYLGAFIVAGFAVFFDFADFFAI